MILKTRFSRPQLHERKIPELKRRKKSKVNKTLTSRGNRKSIQHSHYFFTKTTQKNVSYKKSLLIFFLLVLHIYGS